MLHLLPRASIRHASRQAAPPSNRGGRKSSFDSPRRRRSLVKGGVKGRTNNPRKNAADSRLYLNWMLLHPCQRYEGNYAAQGTHMPPEGCIMPGCHRMDVLKAITVQSGAATCRKGFVICFLKVSLVCVGSIVAAVQPTACGTLRKHFTKLFLRAATSQCTSKRGCQTKHCVRSPLKRRWWRQ